jgi:hypothetical protein
MDKGFRAMQNDCAGRCYRKGETVDSMREIETDGVIGYGNQRLQMQKTRRLFPERRVFLSRAG